MLRPRPGRTAHCGCPVRPAGLPDPPGPRHRRARPVHSRPAAGPPNPVPAGHRPHHVRYRTSAGPAIRMRVPHPIKARNRGLCPAYPTRAADLRPPRSPACRSYLVASPVVCRRKCRRSTVIRNRPRARRHRPGRDPTAWPNNPPVRRARNRIRSPGNATASSPGWRACDRRGGSRPARRPPPTRRADTTVKDVRSA